MSDFRQSNSGSRSAPLVEVVPVGRLNQTAAAVAAANLHTLLGLPAKVVKPWPEPEYALIPARGQYDAGLILQALAEGQGEPPLRLGLIRRDLCLPFLSYVYGEAQMEGRAAVVSLYRLEKVSDHVEEGRSLMLERLAKVVLHEMAHVLGLVHCRVTGCPMNFSPNLASLDRLGLEFCRACSSKLASRRRALLRAASRSPARLGP